jgi:hypothetical protein
MRLKRDGLHEKFINLSSEKSMSWRAVISPYMGEAKHLTIYWHSNGDKPKAIYDKLENTIGPFTAPLPNAID